MRFREILWLVICPVLLGGCLFDKQKDKIVQVSPEFSIKMFEKLGESKDFQLHVSSIANQSCTNFTINLSSILSGGKLTLRINEIIQPSFCLEGLGPAKGEANLGPVTIGSFKVNIQLKDALSNEGTLKVTDDEFKLELKTSDGLEVIFPSLLRIPTGTIWGYVAYDNKAEVGNLPDSFLADLKTLTQDSGLKEGYYGYFSVDKSLNLKFDPPPSNQFHTTFKFWFEGSPQTLQKLIDGYGKAQGGEKMKIRLYTWEGLVF